MIFTLFLLLTPFCYLSPYPSYFIAFCQLAYLCLYHKSLKPQLNPIIPSSLLLVFIFQILCLPWLNTQLFSEFLLNWIRLLFSCLTFVYVQKMHPNILARLLRHIIIFSVIPITIFLALHTIITDLAATSSYPFKNPLWFGESNILCIYTILPLVIAISTTSSKPFARRLFIIALIIIQLSFSSSWFGVLLGTSLFNYRKLFSLPSLRGFKSFSNSFYVLTLLLLLLPFFLILFSKALSELTVISVRSAAIFAAFPNFLKSPFIGYGAGLTDFVIRAQSSVDNNTIEKLLDSGTSLNIMNSFLEILFEYGFISFLLLIIFFVRQLLSAALLYRPILVLLLLPPLFVPGLLFSFGYIFYLSTFIRMSSFLAHEATMPLAPPSLELPYRTTV